MLYFMDDKPFYTSPTLIKQAYRVRINDYLIENSYTYRQLFAEDRKKILDDIVAGIQIPAIYKKEAYVDVNSYFFTLSCYTGRIVTLNVHFLIEKFQYDIDLWDKHFNDIHEDAVNTFFPSYDVNHQGKVGLIEYEDIFKGATKTKHISTFLEVFGFTLPNQEKDIIIRVDEKASFIIKSDATMQSYYSTLNLSDPPQGGYRRERVFAIINDSVYSCEWDNEKGKMDLAEKTFGEIASGVTNKEVRNRMKKRAENFADIYFSIPEDCVVYTIPELTDLLAPEI